MVTPREFMAKRGYRLERAEFAAAPPYVLAIYEVIRKDEEWCKAVAALVSSKRRRALRYFATKRGVRC